MSGLTVDCASRVDSVCALESDRFRGPVSGGFPTGRPLPEFSRAGGSANGAALKTTDDQVVFSCVDPPPTSSKAPL